MATSYASRDGYDLRTVDPALLRDPPRNPNQMDEEMYRLLVEAIQTVGFLQPVLAEEDADTGELIIVDGCHRVRAAKEIGLTAVPVLVGDFSEEPDLARAVQIGMNRLRGQLDLASVAKEVASLVDKGWSTAQLHLTGFSGSELDDLLATTRRGDEHVLEGAVGAPPGLEDTHEDEDASPRPFTLELTFAQRRDLARVKRALKKAAGKGGELADGLLRILDASA